MSYNNGDSRVEITLVATRIPEGGKVLVQYGVSKEPKFTRPDAVRDHVNVRAVRALDVGLEWRGEDGEKINASDKWASESFVLVADASE